MLRRLIIITAVILLIYAAAFAEGVVTADSGDSNVRTGPDLDAEGIGVLHRGESAPYAGEISTDDRGVDWYSITYDGETGWVSSRYTELSLDGEVYAEEKTADDRTVPGSYKGIYGYSCEIGDSPARVSVYEPDGNLLISCAYSPVQDGEGFVSVSSGSEIDFFPRDCNGSEAILLYINDNFTDMLLLQESA